MRRSYKAVNLPNLRRCIVALTENCSYLEMASCGKDLKEIIHNVLYDSKRSEVRSLVWVFNA